VIYEPPPNPDDWICDALPPRHIPELPDAPRAAPQPWEEPTTWASLIAYPNRYRARHGAVAHF
jgi:hypothetical protein